jgi:hypothetical protein
MCKLAKQSYNGGGYGQVSRNNTGGYGQVSRNNKMMRPSYAVAKRSRPSPRRQNKSRSRFSRRLTNSGLIRYYISIWNRIRQGLY